MDDHKEDSDEEYKMSYKALDPISKIYGTLPDPNISKENHHRFESEFLDTKAAASHPIENQVLFDNGLVIYFPYKPYKC